MALAAILVVSILALGMERLAFRPLRRANPATLLIASFAVSYLVQHIVLITFGARPMGVDFMAQLGESVDLGGLRVPRLQIATIIVTLALMGGLVLFFRRSRVGVQMRRPPSFTMAQLVGVRANLVFARSPSPSPACWPASCRSICLTGSVSTRWASAWC
jgi:branched-chain amino acid transport system permease protein